ncbi:pyrimidine/purine nucleoside phosphorylase [Uruburuella testudinis]|uniref:Pyrimidine/purine nucleoside phosphorylase n=1 Tax=Uruburuella testudinis TaxID=1282863 RepID=A0ABY4DS55_9NEIS|nr:pyrimidine/purine nucleoside phosphorylase [Uruburuella testudinis]UOO80829.1 pyrimidine/purine nucleoside phosphorylase [Uruburuella testudinis]
MLKVNQYFDGKVASIALNTATLPATVGVMLPGEYTFGTQQFETMTVISGALTVLLPGAAQWQTFADGDSFTVAANQEFKVQVAADTAYFCTYGE